MFLLCVLTGAEHTVMSHSKTFLTHCPLEVLLPTCGLYTNKLHFIIDLYCIFTCTGTSDFSGISDFSACCLNVISKTPKMFNVFLYLAMSHKINIR